MNAAPWRDKLARFVRLSGADKWLLLRAAWWLAIARVMLAVVPFGRLAERLSSRSGSGSGGEAGPGSAPGSAPGSGAIDAVPDPEFLRRVGRAVSVAASHVPWRADCFPQTIAARMLLQRQGYASIIHLGVERVGEAGLAAHAWLTCGEIVVTGGAELERYTEVHRLRA